MDERIAQFRLGVMVSAALIITGILVVIFGELPTFFGPGQMTIYIYFDEAPGVARNSPVRKSGILIGRVTDVEFSGDGVLVTASINDDVVIPRSDVCQIQGSLLGGDAVLQFVPSGDKNLPRTPLESGDRVIGVVGLDPIRMIGQMESTLGQAVGSVATTSESFGQLANRINDLLADNGDQIARVTVKAEQTLDGISKIVANLDQVLGDDQVRNDLKQSLTELPKFLTEGRQALEGIQETLELADRNFRNLEGLTEPLGTRGPQMIENVQQATYKLNRVLDDFSQLTQALNNPDGSFGALLNDPELYNNLNSTLRNIDDITCQLKPILSDVRAITYKTALDPGGEIGVRGILNKRTGLIK